MFPDINDVMLGRGGATNNHIGNIRFRQLVNQHKKRYVLASKVDKPKVALEVVQIWRGLDPPGRFLTKTHTKLGDASPWHDVGDKKAREKASQCLREKTPDVIPFVKELERQKEEEKLNKMKLEQATELPTNSEQLAFKVGSATPILVAKSEDAVAALKDGGTSAREKPKRKSREELATSIPTGAALTNVVFDDDDDEETDVIQSPEEYGRKFNEDYQQLLSDLAGSDVKDNGTDSTSAKSRPGLAKGLSGTSWMKSFKTVSSEFSAMDSSSAYSPRYAANEQGESEDDEEVDVIPENAVQASADPSRRPKLVNAPYDRDSRMSIMSDLSSRSLMMGNAADQASRRSVLSTMSDMTELSDALKDMDLSTYGNSQR